MKIFEILNFHRELLNRLYASGVRLEDARYIDLYADYSRMLGDGEKGVLYRGNAFGEVRSQRAQGVFID